MQRSTLRRHSRTLSHRLFASLVGGLLLVPSVAFAQKFDQLPLKTELRLDAFQIQRVLNGELPLGDNRQMFDQFFGEFKFPQLTVVEIPPNIGGKPAKPSDIGKVHQEIMRYLRTATNETARLHLNDLTFASMKGLIAGNYHPSTRYIATLIVGDLDQQLSQGFPPDVTAPVPLAEAALFLLGLLNDDESHDAVKLAALIGLDRHVRYNLADARRAELTATALSIVTRSKPPGNRTPKVHAWFRWRAADLLATLGEVGPQNQVVEALHGMLAEPDAPRSQRCAAADALGRLQYTAESATEATTAIMPDLIQLAFDSCKEDTALGKKRLDQENILNPMRFQLQPDFDAEPVESVFPRRRLATSLFYVRSALAGTSAQAEPNVKTLADTFITQIDAAMKLLEDTKKLDYELVPAFTKSCGDLEKAIEGLRKAIGAATPVTEQDAAASDKNLVSTGAAAGQ